MTTQFAIAYEEADTERQHPTYLTPFLDFVEVHDTGKTKRWAVGSAAVRSKPPLGYVRWWPNWRKYTFEVIDNAIFDAQCLTAITDFIEARMAERKEAKDV